jgi:hypothetical protein
MEYGRKGDKGSKRIKEEERMKTGKKIISC